MGASTAIVAIRPRAHSREMSHSSAQASDLKTSPSNVSKSRVERANKRRSVRSRVQKWKLLNFCARCERARVRFNGHETTGAIRSAKTDNSRNALQMRMMIATNSCARRAHANKLLFHFHKRFDCSGADICRFMFVFHGRIQGGRRRCGTRYRRTQVTEESEPEVNRMRSG